MIISASRRTDIPAFFADWFFERLEEGFAPSSNPMNPKQVRRVDLSREAVDGFVFWTKNPLPMMDRLARLSGYAFYFQVTITPYGAEIERHVPPVWEEALPVFLRLAESVGPERMVWRYDPVFLSEDYPMEAHMERFDRMARRLEGSTGRCVFSFLDVYARIRKQMERHGMCAVSDEEKVKLAESFKRSADAANMALLTCAEAIDLSALGIGHARCVDASLLEWQLGRPIKHRKDAGQRPACGCAQSVDIGAYHTCGHGCAYCYAGGGKAENAP